MSILSRLSVPAKINFSFGVLIVIFLVMTVSSSIKMEESKQITDKMIDLRVPTSQASLGMINGMNHSLAALRGWMLLGKDQFKAERAKAWSDEIESSLGTMTTLSASWTNQENIAALNLIRNKLGSSKNTSRKSRTWPTHRPIPRQLKFC